MNKESSNIEINKNNIKSQIEFEINKKDNIKSQIELFEKNNIKSQIKNKIELGSNWINIVFFIEDFTNLKKLKKLILICKNTYKYLIESPLLWKLIWKNKLNMKRKYNGKNTMYYVLDKIGRSIQKQLKSKIKPVKLNTYECNRIWRGTIVKSNINCKSISACSCPLIKDQLGVVTKYKWKSEKNNSIYKKYKIKGQNYLKVNFGSEVVTIAPCNVTIVQANYSNLNLYKTKKIALNHCERETITPKEYFEYKIERLRRTLWNTKRWAIKGLERNIDKYNIKIKEYNKYQKEYEYATKLREPLKKNKSNPIEISNEKDNIECIECNKECNNKVLFTGLPILPNYTSDDEEELDFTERIRICDTIKKLLSNVTGTRKERILKSHKLFIFLAQKKCKKYMNINLNFKQSVKKKIVEFYVNEGLEEAKKWWIDIFGLPFALEMM
jgi:hypothetical protein